jgi:hypothetical protein
MSGKTLRILVSVFLVAAICAGGFTLLAKPDKPAKGWLTCPFPPCMAPCVLGAEPAVLCKTPGERPVATTWACCCCGGSGPANRFRPL